MAQFVHDSFTATPDYVPPHAGETGATWTLINGSAPTMDGAGNLAMGSGCLLASSGVPAAADYKATCSGTYHGGSPYYGGLTGPACRINTGVATGTFYVFGYDFANSQWAIKKSVAGVVTTLGTPVAGSEGGNVELEVTGSGATVTLVGRVNSVDTVTTTDTSGSRITAAGKAGIYQSTNASGIGTYMADFTATDVGGGGGAAPDITSVSPVDGFIGAAGGASTQAITLTGTTLNGTTPSLTISGANVTVTSVVVVNSTTVTANLVMTSSAATGARTLTFSTDDGSDTISFTLRTRAGGSSYISDDGSSMADLKLATARTIFVRMKDSADHLSGKTGLTLTIKASKNGGASATITPTVGELDSVNWPGVYTIALTSVHTDTAGFLKLYITGTGADPLCPEFDVQKTLDLTDKAATNLNTWADNADTISTAKISDVQSTVDPLTKTVPGTYAAGTAGYILGNNLNATVSSRLPTASYTTPPTAAANATATWGATRSGNSTSGTFGEGTLLAANAVTSSVIATDAIGAAQLASAAVQKVWTSALTEAYAADGATFTGAQALYQLWSVIAEATAAGALLTAKKLDGSTTAMTFTLNTASPATATGLTRAS